jgi:hypothetical protein
VVFNDAAAIENEEKEKASILKRRRLQEADEAQDATKEKSRAVASKKRLEKFDRARKLPVAMPCSSSGN